MINIDLADLSELEYILETLEDSEIAFEERKHSLEDELLEVQTLDAKRKVIKELHNLKITRQFNYKIIQSLESKLKAHLRA